MSLESVPDLPPSKRRTLTDELLYGDDIETIPDPEPLITGVLDLNSTGILYGPSGAMKSFVVLDWGLCVATGIPWHGHEVHQARVLYLLGEGLFGTRARYLAWKAHHKIESVTDIVWGPRAVNLQEEAGKREIIEAVLKAEPTLVFLDTIARHIPGGDENSFETMSHVVETLDRIKVETGGAAVGVHHTGKDEANGARGHSSLKGALDTEILCTKGPMLTVTKQKNHPDGHILGTFQPHPVGDSMVLLPKTRRTNPNDELAVKALLALGGRATYGDWKDMAVRMGLPAGSFERTRKRLDENDLTRDLTDPEGGETQIGLLEP